jgi:hypothetical protein
MHCSAPEEPARTAFWISRYTDSMTKVLVSLDDRLLERLDKAAAERRISRSALIAELAAKGLGEPIGPGAHPEVREAIRRMRELTKNAPAGDSTEWIRQDRDSH